MLHKEIPRALRHARELSMLMIDIDHFKDVNDTYGHLAGDSVLRDLANISAEAPAPGRRARALRRRRVLRDPARDRARGRRARSPKSCARWSRSHPFLVEGEQIKVTISIGVAELQKGMDIKAFYRAADEMLYQAKNAGRNRVSAQVTRLRAPTDSKPAGWLRASAEAAWRAQDLGECGQVGMGARSTADRAAGLRRGRCRCG